MSVKNTPLARGDVPPPGARISLEQPRICELLHLPHEVREKIYALVLSAGQFLVWPSEQTQDQLCPAILRTCKQIYDEAAPILYQRNRLTFLHPSDCNVFRWIMDQRQVSKITYAAFRIRDKDSSLWTSYFGSPDDTRSFSADFPNLKSLLIFMKSALWNHARDAEENFRDWHGNSRLRQLCMALEGRTKADVTIVYSVRVPESHLERLRDTQANFLTAAGPTFLRTNKIKIFSSQVVLEILSSQVGEARGGG